MEPSLENILTFVIERTGEKSVNQYTDIYSELGFYGDDWHEMIDAYSVLFSVDIKNYLWYFHTREEGENFMARILFKSPNERVERIKITPYDLFKIAQNGEWNINYPEHSIPKKRYDLIINTILVLLTLVGVIIWYY